MQAKPLSERELVSLCMAELCKKAGFADCNNLVQRDLEFISESIETNTGVLISLSTIKRLMNGQFSRLPQIATLNAISSYLGYNNWQGFKIDKNAETVNTITLPDSAIKEIPAHKLRLSPIPYLKYILGGVLLLFVVFGLFAMLKHSKPPGNFDKAQFSFKKTTSNDIPNTVVFNYNIDDVDADSFFIQQSWDKKRRVKISKKNYTITDIYYEPGYHVAKLIANEQVIKTIDVSIPTDRWFFYAKENSFSNLPQYIRTEDAFKNGALMLNQAEVTNSNIDVRKNQYYVHIYFPSEIKYSSDNYSFKFRIKVNEVKNNICPYFMGEVFCQKNFMYFISSSKGCASEMSLQFGEKFLDGKQNDLSALGSSVTDWQDVEIRVKDKKVHIFIGDDKVYTTSYTQSSGLITGLGFISNGLCEVDYVRLETLDGKVIYNNEFE